MRNVTKQEWIDALRSGDYDQGQGALVKIDEQGECSYCCLGVLAHIAGADRKVVDNHSNLAYDFDGRIESAILPETVAGTLVSDLDLTRVVEYTTDYGSGGTDTDDIMHVLTSRNDHGWTFERIADYLEKLS